MTMQLFIMILLMFPFEAVGLGLPVIRAGVDFDVKYIVAGFIFIIAVRKMNIPYETKHQIHVKVTQKAARFVVDTVGLRLLDDDWAPLNVF